MISRLYRLIPSSIRASLSPLLAGFYLPVRFYVSEESTADTPVTLAFFGLNPGRARLWAKRVLGDRYSESQQGRVWVWNIERYLANERPECDLLMVETSFLTDLLFRRSGFYLMPLWVQLCVDTTRSFREVCQHSIKLKSQIPRQIKKFSLELEKSNSPEYLETFIDQMHIPYIKGRHQDTAFFSSRDDIRNVFEVSELFLIRQGDTRISGVLFERQDDMSALRYIGVLDNNLEYLKMGGIGALYYYCIKASVEEGFKALNLGGTNPILTDGLAFFKLGMRPYVTETTYLENYHIRLKWRNPSSALFELLRQKPYLYLARSGVFNRLVVVDNTEEGYLKNLCTLTRKTACDNVVETLFVVREITGATEEELRSSLPEGARLSVRRWDDMF